MWFWRKKKTKKDKNKRGKLRAAPREFSEFQVFLESHLDNDAYRGQMEGVAPFHQLLTEGAEQTPGARDLSGLDQGPAVPAQHGQLSQRVVGESDEDCNPGAQENKRPPRVKGGRLFQVSGSGGRYSYSSVPRGRMLWAVSPRPGP